MEKVVWKGGALLAPVPPVMVSCGPLERPNIITVGWTGITNTIPPKTYISLRPERYSTPLIRESGVFVVNLTNSPLVRAADFCGVRSGKNVDKFAEMKLTAEPGPATGCPMIAESPLSMECRVTDVIPMGSHDMFLADIVSVLVNPVYLDEAGKTLEPARMFDAAHAIKGVCANLGLVKLSDVASELSEEFRPGNARTMSDEDVRKKIAEVDALLKKASDGISRYESESL